MDSVFHRDGTLAEGPVALCEVQAYVYAARRSAAALARALGDEDRAARLEHQAGELRERFEQAFYPVACAPQAWAAGSVFLLLQACLGLDIDAPAGRICLQRPVLPESLSTVSIRNLTVGDSSVDLVLRRHGDDVGVHLERREGEVMVVK